VTVLYMCRVEFS